MLFSLHSQRLWTRIILIVAALIINMIFLYINYKKGEYCFAMLTYHGEIGYNVAQQNIVKMNTDRTTAIGLRQLQGGYVDYADIDHSVYRAPFKDPDPVDTIGYGVLLGLLWKLTGSYRYLDIQLLQVFIFSALMFLVYEVAYLLFLNQRKALFASVAHLLFFPLIFQNIQPLRDIWAYYGLIILVYAYLNFLKQGCWYRLVLWGILFPLMQWVRPTTFFAFVTLSAALIFYALFRKRVVGLVFGMVLLTAMNNVIFFWIPFIAYNHQTYGRYFVGPVGRDLFAGLGEYENPWKYQLSDKWYGLFMKNHYPHLTTQLEQDDQAKKIFWRSVKERPLFFIKTLIMRLGAQLLPNLPWSIFPSELYAGTTTFIEKIKLGFKKLDVFFDVFVRAFYIRLFIIFGYLGIFLMLRHGYQYQVFVLISLMLGNAKTLLSHIEYRYLVPFYWPLAFFAGYSVWWIIDILKKRKVLREP